MSSLTPLERKTLERVLGMASGYVLDFTNATFEEFVRKTTARNVYDAKYDFGSGSKANRLRAFWVQEDDETVGRLIEELLDYSEASGADFEFCRLVVTRLLGSSGGGRHNPKNATPGLANAAGSVADFRRLERSLRDVMALPPNPRGLAFEQFLDELFYAFGLAPRRSFRLVGEQIDGSFQLQSDTYLVEAKWQSEKSGNRELQAFAGSVRTKSHWSRGLFVSYAGFSEDGLEAFGRGAATPMICMDGLDLWQVVERNLDLAGVLSLKTRRAAETGRAHVPIAELLPMP